MKFYRNMSPEDRSIFKFVIAVFLTGVLAVLAVPFLFRL